MSFLISSLGRHGNRITGISSALSENDINVFLMKMLYFLFPYNPSKQALSCFTGDVLSSWIPPASFVQWIKRGTGHLKKTNSIYTEISLLLWSSWLLLIRGLLPIPEAQWHLLALSRCWMLVAQCRFCFQRELAEVQWKAKERADWSALNTAIASW